MRLTIRTNTKNQILNLSVPGYTGVTSRKINAGDIQNAGIELTLKTTPVKTRNLRWDVDFTFTRNRNKIVDLHPDYIKKTLYGAAGWGNTRVESQAVVGGAYGLLITDSKTAQYVNPIDENDPNNGKFIAKWHSTTRSITNFPNGKRQIVGDMNPDFLGSVNTSLSFKNFRLNMLFDAKIGGDMVTRTGHYGIGNGVLASSLKYRDAEHGGMAFTTNWDQGVNGSHTPVTRSYHDGFIPDVVFYPGTSVDMEDASGNVYKTYPGNMSYQDAYNDGLVDPAHAFGYYIRNYAWPHPASWRQRAISGAMIQENSYVMFREISLSYHVSGKFTQKLGIESMSVSLIGRDLGFLYKTLNDNINPESNNSTKSAASHETNTMPFVRKLGFKLNVGF